MAETGPVRFPGNCLDPSAQEFWPAQNAVFQPQIPLFRPPPSQLYYPYAAPLTVSFSGGGVPQFHTPVTIPVPLPVHVPTPLPTAFVTGPMMVLPQPSLPPPSAVSTRALVLASVPFDVSEYSVREEMEAFGEVRGVQMERLGEGIVTVHFYDLRHAERALKEIRDNHMQLHSEAGETNACAALHRPERGLISGRAVWAHFIIPTSNALPDGNNQGTLVVFNLDPGVSSSKLKDIFQAYGPVKELRETPLKKHQKFVEFYDVRDAAKALREMNGREINGKQVVIEFSRPGGFSRKYLNANNTNNVSKPFKACTPSNISFTNNKYSPPPPSPPPLRFSGRYTPNIPPRSILSRSQSPSKKFVVSDSSRGNPNENNKITGSVETTGGGGGKKSNVKNQNNQATQRNNNGVKHQQQQCSSRGRAWKGKHGRKFDPRFLISEEAMVESNSQDSRTTVMIKNIPNKYSQKLLLNMLDNHCIHCNEQIVDAGDDQPLSSYDFVYLPIDFNNKCNVGYGFVNMTSSQAAWRLYKAFHHQHWEVFNSRKICEVTYARVQALKEHFRNSKFPCEMEHYLPVVFAPPRDGKQLTEPHPVAGEKQQSCGPSPKSNEERDDDDDEHELNSDGGDDCSGGDAAANSCRDQSNKAIANDFNYCTDSVEQQ